MPLYEYQCESCEHIFELIQKFSDPPAETCPKCGGKVRKLVSSPAFQFKGSGWYVTDYARKSDTGKSEKKGAGDSGSSTSSSDTSTKEAKETKDQSSGKDSGGSSTAGKPGKEKT